ncbi:MAG: ubiquinol-cytochrome c reductase iron-sulfur subunit [Gammaproteobacteria bacterium]|nr:ubiquinol-cytochrome c reductase iron-sulfur subunit [Gammaproteobacteria bacterium]
MSDEGMNRTRRQLVALTSAVGAVGAGFAAVPFIQSWTPSERARAAGAPVEVDISKLEPGQMMTVEWRSKPVWILRRTPEMLAGLEKLNATVTDPDSTNADQPGYVAGVERSIKSEYLVLVGICTHLGCSPQTPIKAGAVAAFALGDDWPGGFFCPCHGSKFDLSGRVYKNVPAPTNLPVPPHKYLSDTRLLIGVDQDSDKA